MDALYTVVTDCPLHKRQPSRSHAAHTRKRPSGKDGRGAERADAPAPARTCEHPSRPGPDRLGRRGRPACRRITRHRLSLFPDARQDDLRGGRFQPRPGAAGGLVDHRRAVRASRNSSARPSRASGNTSRSCAPPCRSRCRTWRSNAPASSSRNRIAAAIASTSSATRRCRSSRACASVASTGWSGPCRWSTASRPMSSCATSGAPGTRKSRPSPAGSPTPSSRRRCAMPTARRNRPGARRRRQEERRGIERLFQALGRRGMARRPRACLTRPARPFLTGCCKNTIHRRPRI